MNKKSDNGASLVEFLLIALVFFIVIFATVALGVDAYHRFVAGEETEEEQAVQPPDTEDI